MFACISSQQFVIYLTGPAPLSTTTITATAVLAFTLLLTLNMVWSLMLCGPMWNTVFQESVQLCFVQVRRSRTCTECRIVHAHCLRHRRTMVVKKPASDREPCLSAPGVMSKNGYRQGANCGGNYGDGDNDSRRDDGDCDGDGDDEDD